MEEKAKKKPGKKRLIRIIVILLVCLTAFRIYLPTIVLRFVNRELNKIPGYRGHVDDISLSLWRCAYQIKGLRLDKLTGEVPVPFFYTQKMDLSLEWKALFHGFISGEIIFYKPNINFVNGPTESSSQTGIDKSWIQVVKALIPLHINRVDIKNGEIHYMDFYSVPRVDISLSNIEASATNLRNKVNKDSVLSSTIKVWATCFQTGTLSIDMTLDPMNPLPTFELKEKMSHASLTSLSDFSQAYFKVNINGGNFELYTEIVAKDGNFIGYTKPMFHDIKLNTSYKDNKTIWRWLIANGTQLITNIFSNPNYNKQLATRIPIYGKFDKPQSDKWAAVGSLLRNAFIEALTPSLDTTLHIKDVDKAISSE
jgi:hypothetical protein